MKLAGKLVGPNACNRQAQKQRTQDRFIVCRESPLSPLSFHDMAKQIVAPVQHFGPFFFPPMSPVPPVVTKVPPYHTHDHVLDAPMMIPQRHLLGTCLEPPTAIFAVGLGLSCYIWRPSKKIVEMPFGHEVTCVSLGIDARDVAVGGFNRHAVVIDTETRESYASLPRLPLGDTPTSSVRIMKWLDLKTMLVSINNHIGIWDVRSAECQLLFSTSGMLEGCDVKNMKVVTTAAEETRFELHDLRRCVAPYFTGDMELPAVANVVGRSKSLSARVSTDGVTGHAVFSPTANVLYTHSPSGLSRWSLNGTRLQTTGTGPCCRHGWEPEYEWGSACISGCGTFLASSYDGRTRINRLQPHRGGTMAGLVKVYDNNDNGVVLDMGFLNTEEGMDEMLKKNGTLPNPDNSLVSLCEKECLTLNHVRLPRRKKKKRRAGAGISAGAGGFGGANSGTRGKRAMGGGGARAQWTSRLGIR